MPLAPDWQHPFVNVFKICDVDTLKEFELKGDVTEHMDKIIGKKVFKVRGIIPAGNYLRVPRTKLQTLGLTGRMLYIQLKVTPVKVFVIHIEAVTEDNNVHRISVSNMYSQDTARRKSNGVQLAFPAASHRWCVLAVDLRAALRGFTSSPYAGLKAVQLCSWLTVRTMFTSDYKFALETLPSDMALSHALDTGIFEMVWLPEEPADAPTLDFMPPPKRITGGRRRTLDPNPTSTAAAGSAGTRSAGGVRSSASGRTGVGAAAGGSLGTRAAKASPPASASTRSKKTSQRTGASGGSGGGSGSGVGRRAGGSSGGGGGSGRGVRTGGGGSAAGRGGSGGGDEAVDQDQDVDRVGSGSYSEDFEDDDGEEGGGEDDDTDRGTPPPSTPLISDQQLSGSLSLSLSQSQPQLHLAQHGRSQRVPIRQPLPLSPATAAAAARRATAANIAAGTAAGAVVGAAAVPLRPGDPSPAGFPHRHPALFTGGDGAPPASRRRPMTASTLGVTDAATAAAASPTLVPDPALQLVRMNAYSGEFLRCLVWIPGTDDVAFAAASAVVIMNVADGPPLPPAAAAAVAAAQPPGSGRPGSEPGRQRHLLGHTAFVCALAVASNGELLASAQEGKEAVVRLWDVASGACLAILNAHTSGLSCVDISPDVRAVAAVGLDGQARQTIALWNIAEMRNPHRKIDLVTRHATEFNIKVLRFSAYQEDHLMTAGRDSIRVYRLKGGQLRGTSVRLVPQDKRVTSHIGGVSAALGPNIFTDIAFEAGVGVYGADAFKVYVSSASGAVFQVDYTTRQLDCIYQLHSAPINCLLVADGLAITGADDRLLRAWPLDFKDYLLEAEHEGSVTGLALSPDALRVAIGTENGTLGCLHIPNHSYSTLLRSHSAAVNAVAVDPNRDQYCTVSSDGTLRIWHLLTHQQLYEFDAPGEAVTCIAYHPLPAHHELAAGFANGRLRVFDVATTTLIQEQQQHRAALAELVFSPSGDRLFSGGTDGALVMYDVPRLYAPTQYLSAGVRDIKVCVAVSPDGRLFASLNRDPYRSITSLLLFHGASLDPFMRIETDAPAYVKLAFSPDARELWGLTADRRLDRYELTDGHLVQQISDVSPLELHTLAMDPAGRYVLTAGADGLVRLWGRLPVPSLQQHQGRSSSSVPPHQAFLGHPSTVLGAAFHRGHVITVGEADCICVWRLTADFLAHPHLLAANAARAAAALRIASLPPQLRPPDAPSLPASAAPGPVALYAYPPLGSAPASPAALAALNPHDPLSRATPATAMGPVADPADHRLTTRAAALGLMSPLPQGTVLVPAPAVPLAWPPVAIGATTTTTAAGAVGAGPLQPLQQPQQLYYVATQQQQQQGVGHGGQTHGSSPAVVVTSSPSSAAAFNATAAALAATQISSPTTHSSSAPAGQGGGGPPTFAPRPVPLAGGTPTMAAVPPQPPPPPQPSSPYGAGATAGRYTSPLAAQWAAAATAASPPQPHTALSPPQPHLSPSQPQQQQHPHPLLTPTAPLPPPSCAWLLGYTPTGCANVSWRPDTGSFAYVVEDMVVLEHLATRRQRYLRGHSRPLACLATSPDGALVAAAPLAPEPYPVEPSSDAAALAVPCATAPFADVVVWEVASGREMWRLRYHTKAVQALSFSPDGRWLLSLGREPERSVVLWDVAAGALVAAGRTERLPLAADWLWGGDHPAFATVGPEGLNLWTLQDSFLEQRGVPLSDPDAPVPCTAVAVDPAGALLVAEAPFSTSTSGAAGGGYGPGGSGLAGGGATAAAAAAAEAGGPRVAVWHVEVARAIAGGDATMAQVASLPGDAAVTAMAVGHGHALLGTDQGLLLRFSRNTLSGTWTEEGSVRLDGRVLSLSAEPGMGDAVVATATSTIWFVGMQDGSAVPIVCGQPAPVQALLPAPHDPRVMASTSQDGLLRVWRLGPEDAEPIIELQSSSACTAAAFVLRAARRPPPGSSSSSLDPQPSTSTSSVAGVHTNDSLLTRSSPFAATAPDLLAGGGRDPANSTATTIVQQALLLGGYADGSLRLFALEPAVELQWALARHPAPVVGVVAHPLRPLALTASSDGSIAITDLNSTRLVSYITLFTGLAQPHDPATTTATTSSSRSRPGSPSPTRRAAAAGGRTPGSASRGAGGSGKAGVGGSPGRRSPKSPASALAAAGGQQLEPRPGTGPMQAFAVSPGVGASVAAAAWRDRFVVFAAPWDDPTCTPISAYDCRPETGRPGTATTTTTPTTPTPVRQPPDVPALVAFVGGATKLVTYSTPLALGVVLVFDYRLGVAVRRVTVPQMIRSMALSPDGTALVLGSSERTVYLVALATGTHQALAGHTGPVVAVGFSGDGSHAVTAAGNVLMVWDAGEVLRRLEPPVAPPPRRTLFAF